MAIQFGRRRRRRLLARLIAGSAGLELAVFQPTHRHPLALGAALYPSHDRPGARKRHHNACRVARSSWPAHDMPPIAAPLDAAQWRWLHRVLCLWCRFGDPQKLGIRSAIGEL